MRYVATHAVPKALTLEEVEIASAKDTALTGVRDCMTSNCWPKANILKPYYLIRNELTVQNTLLLKGIRLVILEALRATVLNLAGHAAHEDVVKIKSLL